MLLQAVQDAMSVSYGRRNGALRWMSSQDEGTFSFLFVCRVVDRDPGEVRQFCKDQMARRMPEVMFRGLYEQSPQTYTASAA
jgi:hypothetical protein